MTISKQLKKIHTQLRASVSRDRGSSFSFSENLLRILVYISSLSPRQVADLLGHSTSQITEMYYVKKGTQRLNGITDGFNL